MIAKSRQKVHVLSEWRRGPTLAVRSYRPCTCRRHDYIWLPTFNSDLNCKVLHDMINANSHG